MPDTTCGSDPHPPATCWFGIAHNNLYAYGGLDDIAARLMQLGFREGSPPSIGPHAHYYRREFDPDAAEVLNWFRRLWGHEREFCSRRWSE